jgi:hypothetical protein
MQREDVVKKAPFLGKKQVEGGEDKTLGIRGHVWHQQKFAYFALSHLSEPWTVENS